MVWFGLVSLFNGISTFVGYLMPKPILLEEQMWYYLTSLQFGLVSLFNGISAFVGYLMPKPFF